MFKEKSESNESQKKQSFVSEAFEYLEVFIFAACAVLIVFLTAFRLCTVDGDSMNKTFSSGESLVISDIAYKPQMGDVIVFHETGEFYNQALVKRVIATEGQWISIVYNQDNTMSVYVSEDENITEDDLLDEPYAYLLGGLQSNYTRLPSTPVRVPAGQVFVMGDNRYNSSDSRSERIGFVDERQILGKVLLRVAPLSKFGAVN